MVLNAFLLNLMDQLKLYILMIRTTFEIGVVTVVRLLQEAQFKYLYVFTVRSSL